MFLCNRFQQRLFHFLRMFLCVALLVACGDNQPVQQPVRVVAFGDSLTAGYRLSANDAVPAQLQEMFHQAGHSGVRLLNMGISGDTTEDGLSRLNLVLEAEPDIVILELGANDMLRNKPAATARSNLALMIEAMLERDIIVILSGVEVPSLLAIGNRRLGEYRPMFQSLADEYGVLFYPNFLQGVLGKSNLNLPDGLHPNAEGTHEIARRLYPLVLKAAREAVKKK